MMFLPISLGLILLCLVADDAASHDFRSPDEPGYRISLGDEETGEQTEQDLAYLNCAMREYLNFDYVEACAIFKKDGRRYLDCRHRPGTYENIPSNKLSDDRDKVTNICSIETFSDAKSSNSHTDLWSLLFGD